MNTFKTSAVLDDASHLTLREPLPLPAGREYQVIVLVDEGDKPSSGWPDGFFDEIYIDDPTFVRPPQGELPPVRGLDS